MNVLKHLPHERKIPMFAVILLGTIVLSSGTSRAGLTLESSSGTIEFALNTISSTAVQGSPQYNGDGSLASPGGGYPKLTGLLGDSSYQFASTDTISPNFTSTATTNSSSPTGFVPSDYGTAATEVYAAVSGSQGSSTNKGGVFWTTTTTLADNLEAGSGLASVSLSTATAMFTNTGSGNLRLTPGALLSVNGTLGSGSTSFVAAGLSSSFTLSGAGVTTSTTALDSITLAAGRSFSSIASYGNDPNGAASLTSAGGIVSGTGSTFNLGGQITLLPGESITISAVLTLISDPESSIGISSGLSPGFPTDPSFIPTFGISADSPPALVPEPSTIVLLGAGLAAAGLWTRSKRHRSANGQRYPNPLTSMV